MTCEHERTAELLQYAQTICTKRDIQNTKSDKSQIDESNFNFKNKERIPQVTFPVWKKRHANIRDL